LRHPRGALTVEPAMAPAPVLTRCSYGPLCGLTQSLRLPVLTKVINWSSQPNRLLKKSSRKESGRNLECADNGGALDFLAFRYLRIQSGVALRLPPHSKYVFSTLLGLNLHFSHHTPRPPEEEPAQQGERNRRRPHSGP